MGVDEEAVRKVLADAEPWMRDYKAKKAAAVAALNALPPVTPVVDETNEFCRLCGYVGGFARYDADDNPVPNPTHECPRLRGAMTLEQEARLLDALNRSPDDWAVPGDAGYSNVLFVVEDWKVVVYFRGYDDSCHWRYIDTVTSPEGEVFQCFADPADGERAAAGVFQNWQPHWRLCRKDLFYGDRLPRDERTPPERDGPLGRSAMATVPRAGASVARAIVGMLVEAAKSRLDRG